MADMNINITGRYIGPKGAGRVGGTPAYGSKEMKSRLSKKGLEQFFPGQSVKVSGTKARGGAGNAGEGNFFDKLNKMFTQPMYDAMRVFGVSFRQIAGIRLAGKVGGSKGIGGKLAGGSAAKGAGAKAAGGAAAGAGLATAGVGAILLVIAFTLKKIYDNSEVIKMLTTVIRATFGMFGDTMLLLYLAAAEQINAINRMFDNIVAIKDWIVDKVGSLIEKWKMFMADPFGALKWAGLLTLDTLEWVGLIDLDALEWLGAKALDGLEFVGAKALDGLEWVGMKALDGFEWVGMKALDGLEWVGAKALDGLEWVGMKALDGLEWVGMKALDGFEWVGMKALDGLEWVGAKALDGLEFVGLKSVATEAFTGLYSLGSMTFSGLKALGNLAFDGLKWIAEQSFDGLKKLVETVGDLSTVTSGGGGNKWTDPDTYLGWMG